MFLFSSFVAGRASHAMLSDQRARIPPIPAQLLEGTAPLAGPAAAAGLASTRARRPPPSGPPRTARGGRRRPPVTPLTQQSENDTKGRQLEAPLAKERLRFAHSEQYRANPVASDLLRRRGAHRGNALGFAGRIPKARIGGPATSLSSSTELRNLTIAFRRRHWRLRRCAVWAAPRRPLSPPAPGPLGPPAPQTQTQMETQTQAQAQTLTQIRTQTPQRSAKANQRAK